MSTEDIPGGTRRRLASVHKLPKPLSVHDMRGGCGIGHTA